MSSDIPANWREEQIRSLMAENGEDKLLAVARHIAKRLGRTETMTNDILQIFSTFDGRFSREKMSEKNDENNPRALEHALKVLDRRINQFVSIDQPIWSNSADSTGFLDEIDELIATICDWDHFGGEKLIASCLDRGDEILQQAMFQLEDEFKLLMQRSCEFNVYNLLPPRRMIRALLCWAEIVWKCK